MSHRQTSSDSEGSTVNQRDIDGPVVILRVAQSSTIIDSDSQVVNQKDTLTRYDIDTRSINFYS